MTVKSYSLIFSKSVFGFLIVLLNASIVLSQAILNYYYPLNPLTAPIIEFITIVGNAGVILLSIEQVQAPPP